jgi:predicted dithiol-disulfide oxidoreductase (DUF899 family)
MAALNAKRREITALQNEMRALQAQVEPHEVADYVLAGWDGPVRLSELFGDKRDLILIHNMGTGCTSCTMWADGFNGVYQHLAARAAFVVASPNPVEAEEVRPKSGLAVSHGQLRRVELRRGPGLSSPRRLSR